jgi:hypothetical protein
LPHRVLQSENISILNEDNMKGACDKILKMLDDFVEIISKTVNWETDFCILLYSVHPT